MKSHNFYNKTDHLWPVKGTQFNFRLNILGKNAKNLVKGQIFISGFPFIIVITAETFIIRGPWKGEDFGYRLEHCFHYIDNKIFSSFRDFKCYSFWIG